MTTSRFESGRFGASRFRSPGLRLGNVAGAASVPPLGVGFLGQSEPEHLFASTANYQVVPQPTPGPGNLTVLSRAAVGAPIVTTVVNQASVDADQVNPAMTALSAFLHYVLPGRKFVLGDCAISGTGRGALVDDSVTTRNWSDFTGMIAAIEAETGTTLGHMVENWWNSDAGNIETFKASFWPHYFGRNADGSTFTLGSTVAGGAVTVDHCIFDADAPEGSKGRGALAWSTTTLQQLTPMPFYDNRATAVTEMLNFSGAVTARLQEPDRDVIATLPSEPEAQLVNWSVGPSSHITDFTLDYIHPHRDRADGLILFMWPLAVAILRAAGVTVGEPKIESVEGPDDGAYVDVVVDLPNGGELTTLSLLRANKGGAPLAEVQQLHINPALTGCRLPSGMLGVPGTDTLPAGVTYYPSSGIVEIGASGDPVTLTGWDFTDCYIWAQRPFTLKDCVVQTRTMANDADQVSYGAGIRVREGAVMTAIRTTFKGRGYLKPNLDGLIVCSGDRSGVTSYGAIDTLSRCLFEGYPRDAIKSIDFQRIEWCYFDTPASLKNTPAAHDPGATYSVFDVVTSGGITYYSLTDGNIGNAPPNVTHWQAYDPHADAINAMAQITSGGLVQNCFVNFSTVHRRNVAAGYGEAYGLTDAFRYYSDFDGDAMRAILTRNCIVAHDGANPASGNINEAASSVLNPGTTANRPNSDWEAKTFDTIAVTESINAIESGNSPANTFTNITDYTTGSETEPASPHQQMVTGFEYTEAGGERRPVMRPTQTNYPITHRGNVVIVDPGSGTPRKGRVRIMRDTAMPFGSSVSYLRGPATALLKTDRDENLYPDFLIEHVPHLYDPAAMYPFEGVAVPPYQSELVVPTVAPAFTARSAYFDGATFAASLAVSPAVGTEGMFSAWIREDDTAWNNSLRTIIEVRTNTNQNFALRQSAGRLQMVILNNGANAVTDFFAAPGSVVFAVNTWYHLLSSWSQSRNQWLIFVNGVQVFSGVMGDPTYLGATANRAVIGAAISGGVPWRGDMGHVWLDLTQSLDTSIAANREKFALAGAPVNLGGDGSTPTGSQPQFYFDGDAPGWTNQGSIGPLNQTGATTVGGTPSY